MATQFATEMLVVDMCMPVLCVHISQLMQFTLKYEQDTNEDKQDSEIIIDIRIAFLSS